MEVLKIMEWNENEWNVALLINESTRQWNNEMIDGIYTPVEADMIKAIPLSRCEAEDSLF